MKNMSNYLNYGSCPMGHVLILAGLNIICPKCLVVRVDTMSGVPLNFDYNWRKANLKEIIEVTNLLNKEGVTTNENGQDSGS